MNADAGTTKDAKPVPPEAQDSVLATIDAAPFKAAISSLWKYAPDVRRRWASVPISSLWKYAPDVRRRWASAPILNCFTIAVSDGEMRISHHAIDMDVTAHLRAAGSGRVVVPATALLAFVAAADGDEVELRKDVGDTRVVISCGTAKASVVPMAVGDLPMCFDSLPAAARSFELAENVFQWLTALPAACWSTNDTRYYLNGICLEIGEKEVHAVATNGAMLGYRKAGVGHELAAWEPKPIIPREVVSAARGTISSNECRVEFFSVSGERPKFAYNDATRKREEVGKEFFEEPRFVRFRSPGWTVTAKLIDGTFPDWRRVVPANEVTSTLEIGAGSIKRASALAGRAKVRGMDSRTVGITHKDDGVTFSMKSADLGDFEINAPGTSTARFDDFGINIHFLATLVSAFAATALKLAIIDRISPIRIEPPNNLTGEFAILMPLRY